MATAFYVCVRVGQPPRRMVLHAVHTQSASRPFASPLRLGREGLVGLYTNAAISALADERCYFGVALKAGMTSAAKYANDAGVVRVNST